MFSPGFTLVELGIVIVVLGILAGISVVGYGAWQSRLAANVLKSDLSQAAAQLKNDLNWKNTYPETASGLPRSDGAIYEYDRIASNQYCLTAMSSRQGVPAFHISSDSMAVEEGVCDGHIDPSAPYPTTMQAFAKGYCTSLPVFTGSNNDAIRTLTDTRDSKQYRIAKLADNKCWMLDNLKLGSTTGTITLTPGGTNITSNFILPQLTASGAASYDSPRAYGPVPGDTGGGATNYGYLYNWPAVTAGESRTSHSQTAGDAPSSICPKGWGLPSGGTTSSNFVQLDIAFGGTGVGAFQPNTPSLLHWRANGPFKGVLPGSYYTDQFSSQTLYGFWWSSSVSSSDLDLAFHARINYLNNSAGTLYPGDATYPRSAGLSVRCTLK